MIQYFPPAPCTRAIDYFVSQHVPCNWPVYGIQIEGMAIHWLWFRPAKKCCSFDWWGDQNQGKRTKRIVWEQPLHCSFSSSRNLCCFPNGDVPLHCHGNSVESTSKQTSSSEDQSCYKRQSCWLTYLLPLV